MKKKSCNYLKRRRKTPLLSFISNVACFVLVMSFMGLTTNVMADNSSTGIKASQQQTTVTGKITDQDGEPIPGVTVLEKGTTNGTATSLEGTYTISVSSSESILVFSSIGMISQEIQVGVQTEINLTMEDDIEQLDEVVVIGYGTVKKSDLTGAVGVVKSDELTKITSSTVSTALQGKISGVTITQSSGAPGAGADIKIRGVGSFGGNNPLILIDGIKSTLDYLNPNDIESVEVLKDAACAAIYGTEGGNGVILITTKKGEIGKTNISFSASTSVYEKPLKTYDLTNAAEYMHVNLIANENALAAGTITQLAVWHTPTYTEKFGDSDWQDEVFQNGVTQNYNISMTGGAENINYLFSMGYYDQKGTIIGTEYNKYNFRFKGDLTKGRLKVSPNIAYMQDFSDYRSFSTTETRKLPPIISVLDDSKPDGYGYNDFGYNVVGASKLRTSEEKNIELMTNLKLEFEVTNDIKLNVNGGIRNYFNNYLEHEPANQISKIANTYTTIEENNYRSIRSTFEPYVSFDKEIGKHGINAIAGMSYEKFTNRNADVFINGKNADDEPAGWDVDPMITTLDAGIGGTPTVGGTEFTSTKFSYFGRANYSYDSKYIVQVLVRRDYSSKFGSDKASGTFPSFSAAWNIHKESFFTPLSSIFSNLRLRASYGKTGTESALDYYDYLALMENGSGYPLGVNQIMSLTKYPASLENRGLHWEETSSINVGLDFGLFESRMTGSLNYYDNKRIDMLLTRPVAPSAGIDDPWVNDATMKNTGFEIELSYRNQLGDLKYNVTGTFATVNNKVTDIAGLQVEKWGDQIDYGLPATKTIVGSPVGSFFLYQYDGVFQTQAEIDAYNALGRDEDGNPDLNAMLPLAEPGDARFVDVNGDGMIDDDDRVFSGSAIPKYEYSFNIELEYKGFDFSAYLYGVGGNKIYNVPRYFSEKMSDNFNLSRTTLNAWTVSNPSTTIPRPILGDPNKNARSSTRFLEDGGFLKVKNVQLGYTLPKNLTEKVGIQRSRIYVSGQNLFTFTKYKGLDPELIERSDVYNTGLDYGPHPLSRTILFGIQLDF